MPTTAPGGLNGTDRVRLDGAAGDDHAGGAVSAAGDVNGDGDIDVGADGADPNGRKSGAAYAVFGFRTIDDGPNRIKRAAGRDGPRAGRCGFAFRAWRERHPCRRPGAARPAGAALHASREARFVLTIFSV